MGKYQVIYADPPWAYRVWSKKGNGRSAESHYPTMSIEEIADLPVKKLADENCALFLWVTFPLLKEIWKVIAAWGFTYKSVAFVWIKQNKKADSLFWGMGYWTRANAEICILATKGSPKRYSKRVHQVIVSHIEEHSKKPEEARRRIEQLMGDAVFQTAGIAQKYNCSLRRLDYMQEQGLMSSVPLGMNMIPIKRALTTTSTAIFVPFTTQELFMGGESLYYGLNALSNNMIMVDRKKLKNPNGLILGTPGCFTGETKLLLPDGRKVSFLELFAEKEEVFVNSFDFQKQELVKARGYDVRCTKEVTELVEVELENGEIVRCTPDHWFLTQSAGYVEACNLKVGAKFIPEHEVKAVRFLSLEEAVPVYDISVEGYQNFLLSCGVVVHNSGKSFAAKREIANVFFATQDDIIIGDPEGEYYPLVHALGGQVIHISPTSHDYINPMDINLDYSDDDNPLGFKSDFILSLCELIMGSRNGIEAEEKSVIDRCLPLVYQKYFENPTPENMPVLGDLYDCLRKQEEVQAQRIATALEIYVNGSLNVCQ